SYHLATAPVLRRLRPNCNFGNRRCSLWALFPFDSKRSSRYMSAATLRKTEAGQTSEVKIDTLPAFCLEAVTRHGKPNTVNEKRGGEWVHVSADQFVRRVRHIALGLSDLGI